MCGGTWKGVQRYADLRGGTRRYAEGCAEVRGGMWRVAWRYTEVCGGMRRYAEGYTEVCRGVCGGTQRDARRYAEVCGCNEPEIMKQTCCEPFDPGAKYSKCSQSKTLQTRLLNSKTKENGVSTPKTVIILTN